MLLQFGLQRLGFYLGQIDGIFGNNTRDAVIRFQRGFGLVPDGIVGNATWNTILPYISGYIIHKIISRRHII